MAIAIQNPLFGLIKNVCSQFDDVSSDGVEVIADLSAYAGKLEGYMEGVDRMIAELKAERERSEATLINIIGWLVGSREAPAEIDPSRLADVLANPS